MWKKGVAAAGAVLVLGGLGLFMFHSATVLEAEVFEVERVDVRRSFSEEGTAVARVERNVSSLHSAEIEELQVGKGERVKEGDLLAVLDSEHLEDEDAEIRSLLDGAVSEVYLQAGDIAGPQAPIMKLIDPGRVQVEVRVLTRDLPDISRDMPVCLFLETREREVEFTGTVSRIFPFAEESLSPLGLEEERVKVIIDPEVPGELEVAPGYPLEVSFTTDEEAGQLVVPQGALFTAQGKDALWVVEEGRAEIRWVETGLETRQRVVITGGLAEGDRVIMDPRLEGLEEGARVTAQIPEDDRSPVE